MGGNAKADDELIRQRKIKSLRMQYKTLTAFGEEKKAEKVRQKLIKVCAI
jgi:hypothetical protein